MINDHLKENNLNKKQLADRLGVSKGYITQILNGNFDHRLSTLVDLALKLGKAPVINYYDLDKYIGEDRQKDKYISETVEYAAVNENIKNYGK